VIEATTTTGRREERKDNRTVDGCSFPSHVKKDPRKRGSPTIIVRVVFVM